MITDHNPNLDFITVDSIHEIKPISKQITYQFIHNHSLPINYKHWPFIGLYKENFPITIDVGRNKLKQIKV